MGKIKCFRLIMTKFVFFKFWVSLLILFNFSFLCLLDETALCFRRVRDRGAVLVYPEEPIFIKVSSPRLELADMSPELKEVVSWLENYLRTQGFGFALDYFDPDTVLISLEEDTVRYSKEMPELLTQTLAGNWTVIFQQLVHHGRDLQVEFATRDRATGELKITTLVFKGAGRGRVHAYISGLVNGMETVYQRPFYIRVPKVLKDFSLGRKEVERLYAEESERTQFSTHAFIGGMDYGYAVAEYKRALAIHKLLFELDGNPAGIPLYTGINLIEEIPVKREGELFMVSREDFLTTPGILTWKELLAVAYELRERVRNYSQDLKVVEQYLDLLWSNDYPYTIENNPRLMERVRSLVKREMLMTTLTKWETSNFRVWDWSRYDAEILEYIRLIYGVSEWNGYSAREVVERFTRSLARTLGAIHGAGGALSNDTEFTSSVASKDISLSGEMQDFMDSAYIPFFGADPEISGIDLSAWQADDRRFALQCIRGFCDKLYSALDENGILTYPDSLDSLYLRIFNEVYAEYYERAKEYMQLKADL
ncbi:MAG: hypothetical protein NC818_05990 [Candidatus Omnitrophica bacterium]|nr:hypothetical protein [Candidatus Omnitrophota bacterium]